MCGYMPVQLTYVNYRFLFWSLKYLCYYYSICIVRTHRMHCIRWGYFYSRSSVVCVSGCVCWSRSWGLQNRLNRSRCRLGSDSCGPKEPSIRWMPRSDEFVCDWWPNGDAAFRQNYLTTHYPRNMYYGITLFTRSFQNSTPPCTIMHYLF